jgi:hypothetical protein
LKSLSKDPGYIESGSLNEVKRKLLQLNLSIMNSVQLVGYIFFIMVALISCSRNIPVNNTYYNYPTLPIPPAQGQQNPLLPFPPVNDSLSGRVFIYNNLVWETWGAPYVEIEIPASHLFLNRGIEVFIDSSSTWISVPFYTVEFGFNVIPIPVNNGYTYDNSYFSSVFLFAITPNNSQLVGTSVSIKIKIL